MKQFKSFTYTGIFIVLTAYAAVAQKHETAPQTPDTKILFIFDGSQSMLGPWEGSRKITIARDYLSALVDSLKHLDRVQMALRVYGHRSEVPPQDCNDTRLEVPFGPNNAGKIKQTLKYLRPKGTTPIAQSLAKAKHDFPPCHHNCRHVIILITDGKEACEGDPCLVSRELQKEGVILKPFIIGIGIDPSFKKTFECAGQYHNVTNKDRLKNTLDIVITEALNTTTAQVNLLDTQGKPTETNVAMTFYNHLSQKVKYNFMHTIDYKGNPDTLTLDPLMPYDLVVHTLPPVRQDSIQLAPGKHNMIGLDAPQGMLKITSPVSSQYRDLKCLVRKKNNPHILNVQDINETEKYITGTYNLEILTLPRLTIEDVQISQSHTTTVKIPKPGILNIGLPSTGYGSLFEEKNSGELSWIYNFRSDKKRESLILQPGNYEIIFRPKSMRKSMYTIRKTFRIQSGSSTTISLY